MTVIPVDRQSSVERCKDRWVIATVRICPAGVRAADRVVRIGAAERVGRAQRENARVRFARREKTLLDRKKHRPACSLAKTMSFDGEVARAATLTGRNRERDSEWSADARFFGQNRLHCESESKAHKDEQVSENSHHLEILHQWFRECAEKRVTAV